MIKQNFFLISFCSLKHYVTLYGVPFLLLFTLQPFTLFLSPIGYYSIVCLSFTHSSHFFVEQNSFSLLHSFTIHEKKCFIPNGSKNLGWKEGKETESQDVALPPTKRNLERTQLQCQKEKEREERASKEIKIHFFLFPLHKVKSSTFNSSFSCSS